MSVAGWQRAGLLAVGAHPGGGTAETDAPGGREVLGHLGDHRDHPAAGAAEVAEPRVPQRAGVSLLGIAMFAAAEGAEHPGAAKDRSQDALPMPQTGGDATALPDHNRRTQTSPKKFLQKSFEFRFQS